MNTDRLRTLADYVRGCSVVVAIMACGVDKVLPDDQWTLSAPIVDIGVVSGKEEYELDGVWFGQILRDQRIVIANIGTRQLRAFSEAGEFLYNVGRRGEGPGEFRNLQGMYLFADDSLAVYDLALLRVSVFTTQGEFVRATTLTVDDRFPEVVGVLADGSFVVSARSRRYPQLGETIQMSYWVQRHGAEGEVLAEYGEFPGETLIGLGRATGVPFIMQPFSTTTLIRVAGSSVFFGDMGQSRLVRVDGKNGELKDTIAWETPPIPVTSRLWKTWVERELAEDLDEESRRARRLAYEREPYRDTLPAFEDFLVEPDETVWVKHYPLPTQDVVTWEKVGHGQRVTVPRSYRVLAIVGERWLIHWQDDVDVEHVGIARIQPR